VTVEWSLLALTRVREIAEYIAADDPDAAIRWFEGLSRAVERLAEFPMSGRFVPGLEGRGVREVVYGAYLIFYRAGERVTIITIRHGQQLMCEREVLASEE
jgi:toxin ParE1/3/4